MRVLVFLIIIKARNILFRNFGNWWQKSKVIKILENGLLMPIKKLKN